MTKVSVRYVICACNSAAEAQLYLLSLSQYSEEIERNFENTNITLSNITILGPEDRGRLQSFSDTTKDVNFTDVTQQVGWDLGQLAGGEF